MVGPPVSLGLASVGLSSPYSVSIEGGHKGSEGRGVQHRHILSEDPGDLT